MFYLAIMHHFTALMLIYLFLPSIYRSHVLFTEFVFYFTFNVDLQVL